MRLLTTLEHPRLRISIFLHNRCFSVKAEDQLYQEIISFREGEIEDLDQLVNLLKNSDYPTRALQRLIGMHENRIQLLESVTEGRNHQEDEII